jgi:hypothetical protein
MPQQTGVVDLRSQADMRIDGAVAFDQLGTAVTSAGDVNGDGFSDILVASRDATNNGRQLSGSVYVVFGQESGSLIDAASVGSRGFRIDGAGAFDHAGDSVAGIGDVNGDGHADVLIGAPDAGNNTRGYSGSAYVVFGKSTTTNVDLNSLGDGGFRIDGASTYDYAGDAVAAAGDVNGDGRSDFLVGAPGTDYNNHPGSGSVYVIFGRASTASIDLQSLGNAGFRIDGAGNYDWAGATISGGGDVNQDGKADILVGVDWPTGQVPSAAGSVYVVFGKASTSPISLGTLGDNGFRIDGAEQYDYAGAAVATAGDVNGDGRSDVLIGAPGADPNGKSSSGSVYVVFGKTSNTVVNLRGLSTSGFQIHGANVNDRLGASLALAGDVNGDGRADLLLGAPTASNTGRIESGSAYVVFGRATPGDLDLASLGDQGFRMDGAQVYYDAGESVASAGDFNGDARPDIVVGSPASSYGSTRSGSAYVVYGFGKPELAYEPITATVGTASSFAPKTFRHTGVASFAVAPPLPPGLDFAPRTGALTGTPAAGARPATYTVTMTDATGTVTAPLDLTVTDFVAPVVRVTARSESIRKHGAVSIRVTVDELCTIDASGAVRIAGSTRSFGLAGARANLGAEGSRTLKLRPASSALRRIQGALANHRRATASVVVHATDDFGNKTTKHLTIRLIR